MSTKVSGRKNNFSLKINVLRFSIIPYEPFVTVTGGDFADLWGVIVGRGHKPMLFLIKTMISGDYPWSFAWIFPSLLCPANPDPICACGSRKSCNQSKKSQKMKRVIFPVVIVVPTFSYGESCNQSLSAISRAASARVLFRCN